MGEDRSEGGGQPSEQTTLDPSEVSVLFEALKDDSDQVRIAVFRALSQLPLAPSDWRQVGEYAVRALSPSDSLTERFAVIDAASAIPLHSVQDLAARSIPAGYVSGRDVYEIDVDPGPPPDEAQEGPVLHPRWAGGDPPGFWEGSDAERARLRDAAEALRPVGDDGFIRDASLVEARHRGLESSTVTYLLELSSRGDFGVGLSNDVVRWIEELQGEFRPDLLGLAEVYRATSLDGWGQAVRWQIAWVVSRGGLRGLVPRLEEALRSGRPEDRMATANLVEEAARYATTPAAPMFGGGIAPGYRTATVFIDEDLPAANGHGARAEPVRGIAAEPPPGPTQPRTRGLEFPPAADGSSADGGLRPTAPGDRATGEHAAEARPPVPEPRWILAQPFDTSDPLSPRAVERAFVANADHVLRAQIGPSRADMRRAEGGPSIDEMLPERGKPYELVLLFAPPAPNAPQAAGITLPPSGASEERIFTFRTGPPGVPFEARISVLHRDRVLQTAMLRGSVVEDRGAALTEDRWTFTIAVVRPGFVGLDERQPFNAAVQTEHTAAGEPAATVARSEAVARFDSKGLARAVDQITRILGGLADDPDSYGGGLDSDASVDLLGRLALQGRELYGTIGRTIEQDLAPEAGATLERIQVMVSDPNDFIPIEFVYDAPPPPLTAAKLCPNWRTALRDGRCDPANHPIDATGLTPFVCPVGFWALSKVIERQVVDEGHTADELQSRDFAVQAIPTAGHNRLPPFSAALFASSQRVDSVKTGLSDAVLATLQEVTAEHAVRAETWLDWAAQIDALMPPLLVLLSHTERAAGTLALEIGHGDLRALGQINRRLVRAGDEPVPVVLLLGCDTAVTDREYESFVGVFRQSGAAVVVGTLAAVLGEHAAPVAQALTEALHEANAVAGDPGPTFGEVMRDLRRQLLADGELMALCLAAYGDADWRLGRA